MIQGALPVLLATFLQNGRRRVPRVTQALRPEASPRDNLIPARILHRRRVLFIYIRRECPSYAANIYLSHFIWNY